MITIAASLIILAFAVRECYLYVKRDLDAIRREEQQAAERAIFEVHRASEHERFRSAWGIE